MISSDDPGSSNLPESAESKDQYGPSGKAVTFSDVGSVDLIALAEFRTTSDVGNAIVVMPPSIHL